MKNKKKIVDCYNCKWVRDIPGNCHKECAHPTKLKIKINPQGIRGGWAFHPLNFDPVWIEDCEGYEPKNKAR